MEVGVELAMDAGETALVQIVPNRLHDRGEAHVLEIILHHHLQVLVDREYRHHIQVGLYLVQNHITIMPCEGMLIEHGEVFFVKLLDGYQQNRGVDIHAHFGVATLQQIALAECLAQVGSY